MGKEIKKAEVAMGRRKGRHTVTSISSARQRLAKPVPQRYAVNKDRRSLLHNGFSYHGTKHVSDTTHT
jgi:hypothetical protein